jgi:hypothetical protein
LLSQTLHSILAQTDHDFEVIIAGHERPSVPELSDSRVTFLEAEFDKPQSLEFYMRDKARKRKMCVREVKRRGAGFVVLCDADDIASNRIVEYVRKNNHPNGYIFTHGWLLEYQSGLLAPVPGARPGPFHQICGSSAIFRLSPDEIGKDFRFGNHRFIAEMAARRGRPFWEAELRGFIYVVNTGISFMDSGSDASERARRMSEKIARHAVPITPEIEAEYSLGDLAKLGARF